MEKEKEENIWKREIYFLGGKGKGGKYLGEGKYDFEEEKKNDSN